MLTALRLPKFIRDDRAGWCIRLVLGSLLLVKVQTPGLWHSERAFPHAPVWDWIPQVPAPLDSVLLLFELGLLLWMMIYPSRNKWLPAVFVIMLVWVFSDQIRLQPWYYLYALMLLPALFYKRPAENRDQPTILLLMQIVVIGLYAWSGIHKHSYDFYNYVHGFISSPLEAYLPASVFELVNKLAYVAPWFELAAALLLTISATRNLAVFMITGMHAYLLLCLGPLGLGWNAIIWPWNISMVLIVWVLFYQAPPLGWRALLNRRMRWVSAPIVLLALVMPALRFADAWDNTLSFCLYSGKTKGLNFFVREGAHTKIPAEGRKHWKKAVEPPGLRYMSADTWSMDELGVPVNPQDRVYRIVGKTLCERYFGTEEFFVMIKRRPGYVIESEIIRCEDY